MKKTTITLLFITLLAQQSTLAQYLKKGDSLPDFYSDQTLNNGGKPIRLSDYKGKLLIIDFWGIKCLGCLLAFPKVDSLQRQFGDKVRFILVNEESMKTTEQFFETRKKIHRPAVPMITGDSLLIKWFDFEGKPFHVWVDETGKITQTIGGYNTTPKTIQQHLQGTDPVINQLTGKKPRIGALLNNDYLSNGIFTSYLGHFTDKEDTSSSTMTNLKRYFYKNASVEELYQDLYTLETGIRFTYIKNLTLLKVKNKAKYSHEFSTDDFDTWSTTNSYTYTIYVPEDREKDLYKIAIDDIDRYFNCRSSLQQMEINCIVLTAIPGKTGSLKSKGGPPADSFFFSSERIQANTENRSLYNQPFTLFAGRLEGKLSGFFRRPFVNETGISGNIDISIPGAVADADTVNLDDWNKALLAKGLQLRMAKRKQTVLVIEENNDTRKIRWVQ